MLIGYARVSTIDQNPALQMDALKTAGCDKVFTEKASGSHRDRPQLKAALNYLREGDTLVVWKLSRLARSLTQVIKTATDINDRGIALKVLTQNIDTSTSEGRLFFHMTAAFDEFQRELIVENTRAGLAAANKRGRRGGRPRAMNEQTIKHAEAMLKDTENYPFIGDVIEKQLNKIELANRFTRAVAVGNPREFTQAEKEEQEIAEACNRLIKNSIICWNYLYLARQLEKAPDAETRKNILRLIATRSPMSWAHINMLGEYDFSEEKLRDALGILPLKSVA